jgi:hypothetical protein
MNEIEFNDALNKIAPFLEGVPDAHLRATQIVSALGVVQERGLSDAIRRGLDRIGITQHITATEMKKIIAEIVQPPHECPTGDHADCTEMIIMDEPGGK